MEVAFVGNHEVNILSGIDLNAGLVPGPGAAGQPLNVLLGRRAVTFSRVGTHNYYDSMKAPGRGDHVGLRQHQGQNNGLCTGRYDHPFLNCRR